MRTWLVVGATLLVVGCKKQKPVEPSERSASTPKPQATQPSLAPSGVEMVIAAPAEHADEFGTGTQLVLDAQGQPMLAFMAHDPAKAQTEHAQQLWFVSYDAAKKAFRAPAKVADRMAPLDDVNRPLAFARDPASGTLLIAFTHAQGETDELELATSKDQGATWSVAKVPQPADAQKATQPSLAIGNGQAHLVWVTGKLAYAHGPVGANPSTWTVTTLPLHEGQSGVHDRAAPSLALDANGQPAVLFGDDLGSGLDFFFQRPGSAPQLVLETRQQNDAFDGRLVFRGANPRAVVWAAVPKNKEWADTLLWSIRSDDGGKSWTAPVHVAGGEGVKINHPFALAIAPGGKLAVAAPGSLAADSRCQDPVLARSDDGTKWSVCSPTPGAPAYDAQWPSVAFQGDKLALAFVTGSDSTASKPGIVFWREP